MKYKMIPEKLEGKDFFRIVALKDFGYVRAGNTGGLIEKESNLSQDGDCWVFEDAMVFDDARVEDDALVGDSAIVSSKARISGRAGVFGDSLVTGEAVVADQAAIKDYSKIYEKAVVSGRAVVTGLSCIYGNAVVDGDTYIHDSISIYGNAKITGESNLEGAGYIGGDAVIDGAELRVTGLIEGDSYIKSFKDILVFDGPARTRSKQSIAFIRSSSGGCHICSSIADGSISDFRKAVLDSFTPGSPVWDRNEYVRDYYGTPDFLLEIIKFAERHFGIEPRRVKVIKK